MGFALGIEARRGNTQQYINEK